MFPEFYHKIRPEKNLVCKMHTLVLFFKQNQFIYKKILLFFVFFVSAEKLKKKTLAIFPCRRDLMQPKHSVVIKDIVNTISSFYSVIVSVSFFMALSTVFHSVNSPDNSPLSHSVLLVSFLPYRTFQQFISLLKSP